MGFKSVPSWIVTASSMPSIWSYFEMFHHSIYHTQHISQDFCTILMCREVTTVIYDCYLVMYFNKSINYYCNAFENCVICAACTLFYLSFFLIFRVLQPCRLSIFIASLSPIPPGQYAFLIDSWKVRDCGCHCQSSQHFWHISKANGSLFIVLTNKPCLHYVQLSTK